MPIYIPSSSRYLLHTGTLSRLPSGSGIFLVVQNRQAFFYEPTAEQFGVEMLVLPMGSERIAPTRLWIAEHAAKTGYAKHVQIDEDLYFHVGQGATSIQLWPQRTMRWRNLLNRHRLKYGFPRKTLPPLRPL